MRTLRKIVAGMSVCAMILAGATLKRIEAQTAKKDVPAAVSVVKRDPSRRVPKNFGKVGLTDDQKEQIYKIQAKHHEKIDELQRELIKVRGEMLTETEGVLTVEQRHLLDQFRKPRVTRNASAKTTVETESKQEESKPIDKK